MSEQEVPLNYPAQWPPNASLRNGYIGFPRRFRKTPRAPVLRGQLTGLALGTCGFSQSCRCCGSQPGPTSGEFPNFPRVKTQLPGLVSWRCWFSAPGTEPGDLFLTNRYLRSRENPCTDAVRKLRDAENWPRATQQVAAARGAS